MGSAQKPLLSAITAASIVSSALLGTLPAAAQTSAAQTPATTHAKHAKTSAHSAHGQAATHQAKAASGALTNAAPDPSLHLAHVTFQDANEVIAPPRSGVKQMPPGGILPSEARPAAGDDCTPHGGRTGIVMRSLER